MFWICLPGIFWYDDKLMKMLVYRHEYWMFILASAKKCHRNKKWWSFGQSVIERSGIIQVCQIVYTCTYTCIHLFTCTWIFNSSNHASLMLINIHTCTFDNESFNLSLRQFTMNFACIIIRGKMIEVISLLKLWHLLRFMTLVKVYISL